PYVCSSGQCSGNCVPGSSRCTSGQKQLCDASGNWQNSPTPSMQLLSNPSFDLGATGWTEMSGLSGAGIINPESEIAPTRAHTAPNVAWLGGYNKGEDKIFQTITIPAGATGMMMTFYYMVETDEDPDGVYDTLDAYISN